MKMLLKDGKHKVLTLSYDDGPVQDIRLIEIMNKYGLKGTFNINTGKYAPEDVVRETFSGKLKLSEAKELYLKSGQEVAVHTLTHPRLNMIDCSEVVYEITEDRKNIEEQYGKITRGMAYPYGAYNDDIVNILRMCGIAYARTTNPTYKFKFPDNWLMIHPTCHHNYENLKELTDTFVNKHPQGVDMFYLWGHSYEFDTNNNWDVIEDFACQAGGHDHIWYATNIEIYEYVEAYKRLQTSYDKKRIYNPTTTDVWFEADKTEYCVKAGETLNLA